MEAIEDLVLAAEDWVLAGRRTISLQIENNLELEPARVWLYDYDYSRGEHFSTVAGIRSYEPSAGLEQQLSEEITILQNQLNSKKEELKQCLTLETSNQTQST